MHFEINVEERSHFGRNHSQKIRESGRVPAIIYGADQSNQAITIDHIELVKNMRHQSFYASIITLVINEKRQTVLLKSYQMHPFKKQINHVDFQRIDDKKEISVAVPLEFSNAETCPGVKLDGGMVNYVMNTLDIQCLPKDLPSKLTVDLHLLSLSRSVLVSDIALPENVRASCLLRGDDLPVATIVTMSNQDSESPKPTSDTPPPPAPTKKS